MSAGLIQGGLDGYFRGSNWRELLADGDVAALARALTLVENGIASADDLLPSSAAKRARSIGITGPPGAGKSTLINALLSVAQARGVRVAVLAFDPSSQRTGGALLGDRMRVEERGDGVFFRSLASRGHLGGTSWFAPEAVRLVSALFDIVLIETVGTGQSEIEVQDLVDVSVVICAPGQGDDVQMCKAGILEIADIFVVNQADRPLADETLRLLRGMVHMGMASKQLASVPVLATVATTGHGVGELLDACLNAGAREAIALSAAAARRAIGAALAAELLRRFSAQLTAAQWECAVAAVRAGEPASAAATALIAGATTSES